MQNEFEHEYKQRQLKRMQRVSWSDTFALIFIALLIWLITLMCWTVGGGWQ